MTTRGFNSFRLAELRAGVKPFRLHFFSRLRSTNDHAAIMRKRGELYAPAIVLASRQTAGRGRGQNSWFSAGGSLTVTFVLPVDSTLAPHHLPLAAGLAVRNAAAEISREGEIQLKWPNDVVYPDADTRPARGKHRPLRKLAGLLCERIDGVDLIGVGLNVNLPGEAMPADLRRRIIFLRQLGGDRAKPMDLTGVLIALSHHLHQTLVRKSETPFPALLKEYDRHHALLGRTMMVLSAPEPPIMGKCEGLDSTGRLLLRNRGGLHKIIAGHIELA